MDRVGLQRQLATGRIHAARLRIVGRDADRATRHRRAVGLVLHRDREIAARGRIDLCRVEFDIACGAQPSDLSRRLLTAVGRVHGQCTADQTDVAVAGNAGAAAAIDGEVSVQIDRTGGHVELSGARAGWQARRGAALDDLVGAERTVGDQLTRPQRLTDGHR